MKSVFVAFILLVALPIGVSAADGYAMQDNVVVCIKDGSSSAIEKEVSLPDGTKINPDGVVNKNGKYSKLFNGMMIDMSGNMLVRDGILMKDGKMLLVQNGDLEPMTNEVVMSNGVRVLPDGSIITKMKDGNMMMMNGLIVSGKSGSVKSKQGGNAGKP